MNFNPMSTRPQDQPRRAVAASKSPSHEGIIPFTLLMLARCMAQRTCQIDGVSFARVAVVARVEEVTEIGNKTVMTIGDNTEEVRVVDGVGEEGVGPGAYYEMVLGVREEKEQIVVVCERCRRVEDFAQVNWHILRVINARLERQNLRNRA